MKKFNLIFDSFNTKVFLSKEKNNKYYGSYRGYEFDYINDKEYEIEGKDKEFLLFINKLLNIIDNYNYNKDYYNFGSFISDFDGNKNYKSNLDKYDVYLKSNLPGIFIHKNNEKNIHNLVGPLTYSDVENMKSKQLYDKEFFLVQNDEIVFYIIDVLEGEYLIVDKINNYIYNTNKYTIIKRDINNEKILITNENEYDAILDLINSFVMIYKNYNKIKSYKDLYREFDNKSLFNDRPYMYYQTTSLVGIYLSMIYDLKYKGLFNKYSFVFIDSDLNIK